ncbi:MAG: hypothetical protein Q7S87_03535 [Agitococcus sp.]|nr:hypothetical protein [Agitococcus sp.]MDO9177647.1 hypothetical protein [Agitococcus sp.]
MREILYRAALNCNHVITQKKIVLRIDAQETGNTLAQLADRLVVATEGIIAQLEPKFDATMPRQEQLAIQFCEEIAGLKGAKPALPDPVRLLEMAHALYLAERNSC